MSRKKEFVRLFNGLYIILKNKSFFSPTAQSKFINDRSLLPERSGVGLLECKTPQVSFTRKEFREGVVGLGTVVHKQTYAHRAHDPCFANPVRNALYCKVS